MHNVVKWPNILYKSCGVNTARFLKYVWPFYNIMHERVNVIKICDRNDAKICDKNDATSGMEKAMRTINTGTQIDIIISSNEFYTFKTEIQQETGKLRKGFIDKKRQSSKPKVLEFESTRFG